MMRWASILTAVAIAAITVASPRFGFIGVVFALVALSIVFWLSAIIDLLRAGPGAQREWWIACLVVVVVLGPLGALAYRIASPSFARDNDDSLYR
ncbi:MAG TPA: hypothetical protein VIK54_16815 [Acidimicrobiia bacterium]